MTAARRLLPLFVLLAGLLATGLAMTFVARLEAERRDARFHELASAVSAAMQARISEQRALLRGVAALFHASASIGGEDFADYVERLRLARNNPGVLGIGYVVRVENRDAMNRITAGMRAAGQPGFTPWPMNDVYPRSAILFLEPRSPANRRAIGFDMLGEPTRAEAMTRARTTGVAALTGRVTLVQDGGAANVPGFLLYVPIGREAGARPGTSAYAQAGWAYSPLRAHEFFGAVLSRPELRGAAVEVFDGSPRPENLLFRTAGFPSEPRTEHMRTLPLAGRTWSVRVVAGPSFEAAAPLQLAWAVAAAGLLISLLIAALTWQQARAVLRTEETVRRRTAELRRANEKLVAASVAREQAEAQLRQMQKIEAIGQLTGGIAHDFNNMLAVIMGNLDIAERRRDEPERVARALDFAKQGAARAADLTQRLLAFGRQQPLQPRALDANRLVAGMGELIRRALGETVRLETVLAGGLWPVHADAAQLENAILNLAINGRDAITAKGDGGGALTIETANCHLDENYARTHEGVTPGRYVMIAVSDTGTGMPPEVAEKALDPFFTTKEVGKGTGLGLSQVFGFVKQSAGHLKIYSEVGEGTTVKIYLPRGSGRAVEPADRADVAQVPRGRPEERILVVEDEEGVRLTTVEMLRDLGYTVVHAVGGEEALRLLGEHGAVALLFTDVVMPGMDGRKLADEARARDPELRVLFTTGYTRNAIVHAGRLDEGVDMLPKPFTAGDLARKVRAALDREARG